MIEDKYLTVHDYLKEIMSVPSLEKLEEITARYREELGELEDTALKSFKKIMAANWQAIPGATQQKKPVAV